jgi:hypothetical protein
VLAIVPDQRSCYSDTTVKTRISNQNNFLAQHTMYRRGAVSFLENYPATFVAAKAVMTSFCFGSIA